MLLAITSFNNLSKKGEPSLKRTIESILKSITSFYNYKKDVKLIISWVDDGSTDRTYEWVLNYTKNNPIFSLFKLENNCYAGFARNVAVERFKSDYILLFDSDDEMFENHLIVCYNIMQIKDRTGCRFGIASTQLCCSENIHPSHLPSMSYVCPFTKVIRREVWDFIEGMPTDYIFRMIGGEDIGFIRKASEFFNVAILDVVTVKYWNYPESSLDNQLAIFKTTGEESRLASQVPHGPIADKISQRSLQINSMIAYLHRKFLFKEELDKCSLISSRWQGERRDNDLIKKYLSETTDPILHITHDAYSFSEKSLNTVKSLVPVNPMPFIYLDYVSKFPLERNSFNRIYLNNILNRVTKPELNILFQECFNLLKDNHGELWLLFYNVTNLFKLCDQDSFYYNQFITKHNIDHLYSQHSIIELLIENGFVKVNFTDFQGCYDLGVLPANFNTEYSLCLKAQHT